MKSTDKSLRQNKLKKKQSSDTLVYILLFILFVVLVGSLAWYFWPTKTELNHNYEEALGDFLSSPTAKDVSKLIQGNRNRLKTAKRILEGKMRGRSLSNREREEVEEELKNVREDLDKFVQSHDLEELEKNNPETLAIIYKQFYEQGKVTVRLKDKTSVGRSKKELIKQKKIQDEWYVSEQEKEDIDKTMKEWIQRWYGRAREKIIDLGEESPLTEYILPLWVKGKKFELKDGKNPSPDVTRSFKEVHQINKNGSVVSIVDLTQPLKIDFQGYYGFLTEEDKKTSSEGKETFGLTKYGGKGNEGKFGILCSNGKVDENGDPIVRPPSPLFFSLVYCGENTLEIKIGFEERLFFNRLGYEEWLTEVKENGSRTYFDICFEEVVETIAHELAHAIINTIRVNYQGEEKGGHGKFFYEIMEQIEKIIKNSPDFENFKTWWEKPEKEQKKWAASSILAAEESHWAKWKYWYISGGVAVLLVGGLIVIFWKELTGSKKNVKN